MKTPLPSPTSADDWLTGCSFQTRNDSVVPGLLNHKIDRIVPVTEDPAVLGLFPLAENFAPAAPKTEAPARKPEDSKKVAAEVHAFSKLAAGVYAPANGRDSLPEYILFAIIALLATAWPIWAMLGTWLHHR